jgi:hypothetical protein
MKWRVERLTDKQTGPKVIEAYQKSVKNTLARVKPQLQTLATTETINELWKSRCAQ